MNELKTFGHKKWAFAAGHIPLVSSGREPAFTSHDKIAIFNFSERKAEVEIQVYYEDQHPVIFKKVIVESKRIRKIRFNDLIDPIPIPLDCPYGFIVTSSESVVIQFSRMNTGNAALAGICTTAYPLVNE